MPDHDTAVEAATIVTDHSYMDADTDQPGVVWKCCGQPPEWHILPEVEAAAHAAGRAEVEAQVEALRDLLRAALHYPEGGRCPWCMSEWLGTRQHSTDCAGVDLLGKS